MEIDPSNHFHLVLLSSPPHSSSFSTVVVVVVAVVPETSVTVPKPTIKSPLVSSHHCDYYLPMMLSLPVQTTFEEIFVPL